MDPQITTEQGIVEGLSSRRVLLGIPHAAPPVGDLRGRPPQPHLAWRGVKPTRRFSAISPRTVGASFDTRVKVQSENRLYLNVWTGGLTATTLRRVMLWIHGGGNLGGAGSGDVSDGTTLAARGAVAVTCAYRLGALVLSRISNSARTSAFFISSPP